MGRISLRRDDLNEVHSGVATTSVRPVGRKCAVYALAPVTHITRTNRCATFVPSVEVVTVDGKIPATPWRKQASWRRMWNTCRRRNLLAAWRRLGLRLPRRCFKSVEPRRKKVSSA